MTAVVKKPEGHVRGSKPQVKVKKPLPEVNQPFDHPLSKKPKVMVEGKLTAYPGKNPPPPVTASVKFALPADGAANKSRRTKS